MTAYKTSGLGEVSTRRTALQWSDVYRGLPDDETRSCAVRAILDAGFSATSFDCQRKAREAVCEALIRIEDRLEGSRKARERAAVRPIRRRLESELWP